MLRSFLADCTGLDVHEIEPHWIVDLWIKYRFRRLPGQRWHKELVTHKKFPTRNRWPNINLEEVDLKKLIEQKHSWNLKEIVYLIFGSLFEDVEGEPHLVLKDPRLLRYMNLMKWLDSDFIAINMIRDPRAVISSYLSRWNSMGICDLATHWSKSVTYATSYSLFQDRIINIKYEDLVEDQGLSVQKALKSFGVEIEPGFSDSNRRVREWNRSSGQMTYSNIVGFDKYKNAKWRKTLSVYEISLIQERCRLLMRKWGYGEVEIDPTVLGFEYFAYRTIDRFLIGPLRRIRKHYLRIFS